MCLIVYTSTNVIPPFIILKDREVNILIHVPIKKTVYFYPITPKGHGLISEYSRFSFGYKVMALYVIDRKIIKMFIKKPVGVQI